MAVLDAGTAFADLPEIPTLSEFCGTVFGSVARSDQRRWAELYVRGLMSVPGRKSIRRICELATSDDGTRCLESFSDLVAGRDPVQSLQQFVNQSPWDWRPVRRAFAEEMSRHLRPRAWVVREVVFPKNGEGSVAVARQYVPSEGRILNCQRALAVFLAGDDGSTPLDWRLVIPKAWDEADARRAKARLPHHERSRPDVQYLLAALDELVGDWGLAPLPVVVKLDNERDVHPLLHGLEERGLSYLVEVPPATPLSARAAQQSPTAGRLAALAARRGRLTLDWREAQTGLVVRSQYATATVPGFSVAADGVEHRRAVRPARHVLTEWPTGRTKPKAVWLTDLGAGDTADLVRLLRARRQTRNVDELTEGVGLRHFEGRSFRGWHHHVTLASVAHGHRLLSRTAAARTATLLRMPA